MEETFHLVLVTPTANKTIAIFWLDIQTKTGSMVIQKGHTPTITLLSPDKEIEFKTENGVVESMVIPSGIAEITRDKTTLLINK